MPKQVLKITNWVGGLNCATDPRDIEANQFAQNWNFTDDVGGILRKVGGAEDSIVNLDHDNTHQQTGFGLFTTSVDYAFSPFDGTFSDGYEKGTTVLYNDLHANAILDNIDDFSANWTRTGDFAIDSTDATYTHSTGAGTLYQTAAEFENAAANDTMYKLTFTINTVSNNFNITSITLKGGSGYIAAEDISLFPDSNPYNNTYVRYFLSAANVSSDKFQLDVASGGTCSFNLDDVSLVKTSAIQLASTPSYIDSSLYDNQDHFQNMTLLIYSGTGVGQTRTILGYNGVQKVAGLDADFVTDPSAAGTSKYMIFRWLSSSFGTSSDNDWITDNTGDGDWPDTDGNFQEDFATHHLITTKTSITNNESSDMGYIELKASGEIKDNDAADPQVDSLTIKPGIEYYFSFYVRLYQKYFGYVSDVSQCDRVPYITLHSTTTTDGTDTGMYLFADNTWISDANSLTEVQKNVVTNGDFENAGGISGGAPQSWTRVGSHITCTEITSNQYGGEGISIQMAPSSSLALADVEIITDEDNRLMTTSTTPDWAEYDEGGTMGAGDHDLDGDILTIIGNSGTTTDEGTQLAVAKMTTLIVGRTYRVSASIYTPTEVSLGGFKIGLGGDTSAAFTISGDTEPVEYDLVITDASVTLKIYFETDSTVPWVVDNVSVKAVEPSSFIYQDITCEENQLYHLNFVHSSAGGPVQYAVVDRTDTAYPYLIPWEVANPTGAITTYKFLNQMKDSLGVGGQLETSYAKFMVPSHSGDRTIRIMMSCTQLSSNCIIDGVTVFKAWNDLATMSKDSFGSNPFGGGITGWNRYTTSFRLPYLFSETDDWVLQIHGGETGYQSGATYDKTTADKQIIEFQDIRLESKQSDDLTFLSDNKASHSKIKIHSSNGGHWDSNFITWQGLKAQPTFTNVYGAIKIVDGNFNNINNNLLFLYTNRKIMNKYPVNGYKLVQSAMCTNPTLKLTFNSDSHLLSTVFDGIDYINTRNAGLHYKGVNWSADTLNTNQGILMGYNAGDSLDEDNLSQFPGEDILDPGDTTAPYTQSSERGLWQPSDTSELDSSYHRDEIYLWLQGQDGTDIDMEYILSSGGDIAKLEYEFDYMALADRKRTNTKHMVDYPGPIIKVECGKVNATILPGGTTQAILKPVIDAASEANTFERIGPTQYFGKLDEDNGISIQESHDGLSVGVSEDTWTTFELEQGEAGDHNKLGKTCSGVFTFEQGQIAKTDDIMFKISMEYPSSSGNNWRYFFIYYQGHSNPKYEKIYMRKLNVYAYDNSYTPAGDSVVYSSGNDLQINFKFGAPSGSSADNWEGRKFSVGVTSVNIFGEENYISEGDIIIGQDSAGTSIITAGQAPIIDVYMGNEILKDTFKKETKIYLKDNESNIWYFLFHIDHDTGKIHSSVSGKESLGTPYPANNFTSWQILREDMLSPNQTDTYESETFLTKSYTSANKNSLTCRYKTSVIANDKLYVGNIYQNGKVYSDRMIISPKGKYNILPDTNFIDVAINDGDEITALAFYKDKLLQFKKKKVFIINTSGDFEFLEDTLQDVGVDQQCQVTMTPFGITWVNKQGCFIYNGEKLTNLIDGKIAPTSDTTFATNNYWILSSGAFTPLIGYLKDKKALIILINTDNWAAASGPEGYEYNFITQSWTFLQARTPDSGYTSGNGNKSNMTIDKDGNLIWHTSILNHIIKWNDAARNYNDTAASDTSVITFTTKDFDFGEPSVRKKIYKIYITYKSTGADSKVKVQHATNGGTSYTDFPDGTNYDATNGLESASSWTTAILKPSSSINNIYSFQLRFIGTTAIPSGFEINDFSIIYRIKRVK